RRPHRTDAGPAGSAGLRTNWRAQSLARVGRRSRGPAGQHRGRRGARRSSGTPRRTSIDVLPPHRRLAAGPVASIFFPRSSHCRPARCRCLRSLEAQPMTPSAFTRRLVAYWTTTGVLAAECFVGGVMGALRLQPFKDVVTHLGYPPYFMTILGVCYVS